MRNISAYQNPGPVEVYLGLGANKGKSVENVFTAFERISNGILSGARLSSLYITDPRDVVEQPKFVNAACCGLFDGSPFELLKKISSIERSLGRNRDNEQRRGPRSIDIDILHFGEYIINEGSENDGEGRWLIVPHERLKQRRFALVPLIELNPHLSDPETGIEYSEIEKSLEGQGIYSFDTVSYIKSHGSKTGRRTAE